METNVISVNVFIVNIATSITIFISLINHFQTRDKFFKSLFQEFNIRYDEMNSALMQLPQNRDFNQIEIETVIKYLNLCAEEYMWVKRGWIPKDVWRSWENGIKMHLQNAEVQRIFNEEKKLWKSSYYGVIDQLLKTAS